MTDRLPSDSPRFQGICVTPEGDAAMVRVNARWAGAMPEISILVPTYRHDPVGLLRALAACRGSDRVEVIVHDDGSGDDGLTAAIIATLETFPGAARLTTAPRNAGRSGARNRLEAAGRAPWLLYLDADMLPDGPGFLQTYLDVIAAHPEPAVVVGGLSLAQTGWRAETALHHAQSLASDCAPVERRRANPGQYVFSGNLLVHREVMQRIRFDTGFDGWGWEDVDWGIRAGALYPIRHIDNTASHLGLDRDRVLLEKYRRSGANFLRIIGAHPQVMGRTALYRYAMRLSRYPGLGLVTMIWKGVVLAPRWLVPVATRLKALKLYRATIYGSHIRNVRRHRRL